jgi:hypothetical protein
MLRSKVRFTPDSFRSEINHLLAKFGSNMLFAIEQQRQPFSSSTSTSVSDPVHKRILTGQTAWRWMKTMYKFVQVETCTIFDKRTMHDATPPFRARDRLRLFACALASQAPKDSLVGKTKCGMKTQRGRIKRQDDARLQKACLSSMERSNDCFLIENYFV